MFTLQQLKISNNGLLEKWIEYHVSRAGTFADLSTDGFLNKLWDDTHFRHYKAVPTKPAEKVRKWVVHQRKVANISEAEYNKLKQARPKRPDNAFPERLNMKTFEKKSFIARIRRSRDVVKERNGHARKIKASKRKAGEADKEVAGDDEEAPPAPKRPRKEIRIDAGEGSSTARNESSRRSTPAKPPTPHARPELLPEVGVMKLSSLSEDVIANLAPHTREMPFHKFMSTAEEDVRFSVGDCYDSIKRAIDEVNGEAERANQRSK